MTGSAEPEPESSLFSAISDTTISTEPGEQWTLESWNREQLTPNYGLDYDEDNQKSISLASPQSVAHRANIRRNHQKAKMDLARNPARRKLTIHASVRNMESFALDSPSPSTPTPWTPRWYAKELALRKSPTVWPPVVDGLGRTIEKYGPPKPDPVERRAKRIDDYEENNKVMTFMRRLYRDLNAACQEMSEPEERVLEREVRELLRIACVWELYKEAPKRVQEVYDARIDAARGGWYKDNMGWAYEHGIMPNEPSKRERVAERVQYVIEQQERHRSGKRAYEFIKEHGLYLFVICAHSHYFRSWIVLGMDDPLTPAGQKPEPFGYLSSRVDDLLDRNRASIEMFVRSRGLDWRKFQPKHQEFFGIFIDMLKTQSPLEPEMGVHGSHGMWKDLKNKFQRRKVWLTDWDTPTRTLDRPTLSFPKKKYHDCHPHEFVLAFDEKKVVHPRVNVPLYLTQESVSQGGFRKRTSILPKIKASPESDEKAFVDFKVIEDSFVAPDYVWPDKALWPIDDPRYRSIETSDRCSLCHRRPKKSDPRTCSCTLNDLQTHYRRTVPAYSANPLIELRQYPVKGVGVRVLQPLYKGDILGEYVGEMYPDIYGIGEGTKLDASHRPGWLSGPNNDKPFYGKYYPGTGTTYHMCCQLEERHNTNNTLEGNRTTDSTSPSDHGYPDFIIDAAVYGNWTRFINHSCNASAIFQMITVGDKSITTVAMVRDLEWGEELTVNYGNYYWTSSRRCECGESNCISTKIVAMASEKRDGGDGHQMSWQVEGDGDSDGDGHDDEFQPTTHGRQSRGKSDSNQRGRKRKTESSNTTSPRGKKLKAAEDVSGI